MQSLNLRSGVLVVGRAFLWVLALEAGLPVAAEYRREEPGTDSDLNAYDVVYVGGDANAGSKTIAINLPNDEEVQLEKGSRRLQLKNAMRAKYEKILEPIADVLIDESQRQHITFDAFFANTMFHEVAHGLGIKYTIDGNSTVGEALRDVASSIEEGKADVLGLYMVTSLYDAGELGDVDLRDYYVTFMTSVFRSIRFGASSAHGKANMVRFNFFVENGAFVRDAETGRYRVDFERMRVAMADLSRHYLDKPIRIEVSPPGKVADKVSHSVHFVPKDQKQDLLIELLDGHRDDRARHQPGNHRRQRPFHAGDDDDDRSLLQKVAERLVTLVEKHPFEQIPETGHGHVVIQPEPALPGGHRQPASALTQDQ